MTDDVKNTREDAVRMLLGTIPTEDVYREGLQDTPNRVARMYEELFSGYLQNPREILSKQFDAGEDPVVVHVSNIEFASMCEHHMLPFFGTVRISYLPKKGGKVAGLSKFARLVECYARRLQLQERMTSEIAHAIMENLHPQEVTVAITATHTCMTVRGVRKEQSVTDTVITLREEA